MNYLKPHQPGFSITELLFAIAIIGAIVFGWSFYSKKNTPKEHISLQNGLNLTNINLPIVPSKLDPQIKKIAPEATITDSTPDGGLTLGTKLAASIGLTTRGAYALTFKAAIGTTGKHHERVTSLGYTVFSVPQMKIDKSMAGHIRRHCQKCDYVMFSPEGKAHTVRAPPGHVIVAVGVSETMDSLTGSAFIYKTYELKSNQPSKTEPNKNATPYKLYGASGLLQGAMTTERCKFMKNGTLLESPAKCFSGMLKTPNGKTTQFGYAFYVNGYGTSEKFETLDGKPVFWLK